MWFEPFVGSRLIISHPSSSNSTQNPNQKVVTEVGNPLVPGSRAAKAAKPEWATTITVEWSGGPAARSAKEAPLTFGARRSK